MGFHHVAVACRDTEATHRFYTEAMGFELVKAVVSPTDHPGSWAKHLFYDTGGDGLIAFWELHDERVDQFDPAIATGLGLPIWTNHLAFSATLDTIGAARDRWLAAGYDVVEIDHEFCVSIYTNDPNGIMVEWCADTRPLGADDRDHALSVVHATAPTMSDPPVPVFHLAAEYEPAVAR